MLVLADTHVFVWAVLDDQRLSVRAREIWLDAGNEIFISPASLWEIAIKVSLGKLELDRPLGEFFSGEIAKNQLQVLEASPLHFAAIATLPFHHRDPFDRMIVAQALAEDLAILSIDQLFDQYAVNRVW